MERSEVNWDLRDHRIKDIAELTAKTRKYQRLSRRNKQIKQLKNYKETVYSLYFEINLYVKNSDKKWDKYLSKIDLDLNNSDFRKKFEEIDKKINSIKNEEQFLEIQNELEKIDEVINDARIDQGLDIPFKVKKDPKKALTEGLS